MRKLRRSALWLAVVIAVGVLFTPQRGAAGPYRVYVPEELPRMGDPDGDPGGRAKYFEWTTIRNLTIRLWTGQILTVDLTRLSLVIRNVPQ